MEQNRKRYSSLAKAIVIGLQMIAAVVAVSQYRVVQYLCQSEYAEYGGSAKFFFRGIRLF